MRGIHAYNKYSTGHGNCSITCMFLACKSAILHGNYTSNTSTEQACKKNTQKILETVCKILHVDCMQLTTFIFGWNMWGVERRSLALKSYLWGKSEWSLIFSYQSSYKIAVDSVSLCRWMFVQFNHLNLLWNFPRLFATRLKLTMIHWAVWNVFNDMRCMGMLVFCFHFVINSAR